jgi:hypothetical protein
MHVPALMRRHKLGTALATIVALPAAAFAVWAFATLHYTYSNGDRAGFLQKISRRGWLCKTWEGELQLTAIPGSTPEIFAFTTSSEAVAAELNRLSGQRVVLMYEQHKGVPTRCFGDTEYFVTGVRPVDAPR